MQRTMVPGVSFWSVWQPDRNLFFNSHFIEAEGGNLIVDPLPLGEADASEIAARGGAAWVVVTNRDHERAAAATASRFGAKIVASEPDAAELTLSPDRIVRDGDEIGPARVIALEGLKSAGEFALHFPALRTVLVGDALWGDPAGSLRLMPDGKLAAPAAAALSLRRLRRAHPKHILVGDGASIFENAYDALNSCLDARDDAWTNVTNVDELHYVSFHSDPGSFALSRAAEIGFGLGARRLGSLAAQLPPGADWCPLHWHTGEEELFLVWEGSATLVMPRGERELRRGDIVCFPTDARSAHKIVNRGTTTCTILMIANVDGGDVCYYPDSKKLVVEATGTLVRTEPQLDYYDGEA